MIKRRKNGYTIVELMVSNVIFSMILLGAMAGLVQIGRLYYKGIFTARTQQVTRSVTEDITQSIKFSNRPVRTAELATGVFCVGPVRYSFVLGTSIDSSNPHALWRDIPDAGCATSPTVASADLTRKDPCEAGQNCTEGIELLSDNMRVTALYVGQDSPGSSLYNLDLAIAFGSNGIDGPLEDDAEGRTVCKGASVGVEFCSISELSTTVLRRVQ